MISNLALRRALKSQILKDKVVEKQIDTKLDIILLQLV